MGERASEGFGTIGDSAAQTKRAIDALKDAGLNKLKKATEDLQGTLVLNSDNTIVTDEDFKSKFVLKDQPHGMSKCSKALGALKSFLEKIEDEEKHDAVEAANNVLHHARGQVNRNAINSLLSKTFITDPKKGAKLRNTVSDIFHAVKANSLQGCFPDDAMRKVDKTLEIEEGDEAAQNEETKEVKNVQPPPVKKPRFKSK